MAFDFKTLSLEGIMALPLDFKRMHKKESKKAEALKEAILEAWLKNEQKYIAVKGVKYKLTKVGP